MDDVIDSKTPIEITGGTGTVSVGTVKGNIVGTIAYLGGILTAVLLLLLEKDNKFVRFHAMQSVITFVVIFVIASMVSIVASIVWVLFVLVPLIWLSGLVLFIFLMYKAYKEELFKVPVIGDFAARHVGI